jgi:MFS family permease
MAVHASGSDSNAGCIWVLALASAANLMAALDALVVSTALTDIGRDLDASTEALEWTVNAYALSFAAFLLTAAALGDRLVFVAGLVLFVAASAACALASDAGWLIAARAVQGLGAAIMMPLALAQVSAAFPPERRGWALGIYSSVAGLSTVLGPVVGGLVTRGLAWPWIFWLNVPFGMAVAALAVIRLRETFGPKGAINLAGLTVATGGAFGLIDAFHVAFLVQWRRSAASGKVGSFAGL